MRKNEKMELITNIQSAVVTANFDEVKNALSEQLREYENLVVTEGTLSGAKTAQKELAGLRNDIEAKRKEVKKAYTKPLDEFERKCKELVALVEQVEAPIKEGIKVFDDARREEKRKTAEELIKIVVAEAELEEKFAKRLDVTDRYLNLTITPLEVRTDLEARATALMVEQRAEHERIDILENVIRTGNQRIKAKISLDTFKWDIENGVPTGTVISKIDAMIESIYQSENAPKPEPKEEPKEEPNPEPKEEPKAEPVKDTSFYEATLKITGSREELISVSNFLKTNGIRYEVVNQHRI